jgi:hypothetical protein
VRQSEPKQIEPPRSQRNAEISLCAPLRSLR